MAVIFLCHKLVWKVKLPASYLQSFKYIFVHIYWRRVVLPALSLSLCSALSSAAGWPLEAVPGEASSLSAHEASAGVCEPKEWRKPGSSMFAGQNWSLRCPFSSCPQALTSTLLLQDVSREELIAILIHPINHSEHWSNNLHKVTEQQCVDASLGLCCVAHSVCTVVLFVFHFQGAKIIQSFMWYLNPRQVFDLTKGGPREG